MDVELLNGVRNITPDINGKIANGLATEQLLGVEQYIDQIFKGASNVFPDGLTYEGYKRCTPQEEYNEAVRIKDNRQVFELARSDFYLVSYQFKYKGNPLYPRYLYLPFAEDGGIIHVRGNRFSIQPVLADPSFSIGMSSMFIQLTKTRLTFERNVIQHYMANQDRESTYVIWSWVHHGAKNKSKKSMKIVYSTLVNYLFAKYGVTKTFADFAGCDIIVGGHEINSIDYPADEWVVCTTVGIPPRAWPKGIPYMQTNVRVAIPKHQYTPLVKNLVGGLFYIADNFPDNIKPEYVDDPRAWKIILGHIISAKGTSVGLMLREIEEHLLVIDEYVDFIVKQDLHRSGIEIDTIYEMFVHVIEVLSQKTVQSDIAISSVYGKRLITLRYVLHDIVTSINRLTFKLSNALKNKGEDGLDEKTIIALMNKFLRKDRIAGLRHKHGEITSISTSNDCMMFGVTSVIVPQEEATAGVGGVSRINLQNPAKHFHMSLAEVCAYNTLPKADPTGRRRINPFVSLSLDGTVLRDPSLRKMLDESQQKLL